VFASLALFVGVLGARLLVLPRAVPPALERRVYLVATVGAFAAIDAGILAFVLRGANALQLPFVDLLYGDLSPFAEETRFGTAFMVTTLGLAVCAALVMVAWILDFHRLRWPAVALGAVLASGLSLSGHQATEPNASTWTELADWVHLVAALFWVGGLVLLAACVWPLAPSDRRAAFLRFSRLAVALVAVIVVAGTYMAVVRLPELDDLWSTSYGQLLLLKIGIASAALAWGGFHHVFVRPRLLRGEAPAGLRRSLLGESSVAMAVLLAAAILVNGAPPPVEPSGGTAQASAPHG
jgi:copper transport protein